jgi:hypothetical protein
MIARSVGGNIQIPARPGLELRQGETVTLHVLKRLQGTKWAVAIHGRVYPARTELALETGSTLKARVSLVGRLMTLTLAPSDASAANVLGRQGLPAGALSQLIAVSLLRSGLPVAPELVERMRQLLSRSGPRQPRAARALATMADKGISLSGSGTERLVEQLTYGEEGGGRRRGGDRRLPRDGAEAGRAIRAMAGTAAPPGAVTAYNHLKGRSQSWVVFPFLFREGETEYPGTIKILFDPFQGRPLRMALTVHPGGGAGVDFHVGLQGRRPVHVFCGDERLRTRIAASTAVFSAELRNLGFQLDDTIHEEEDFDGFSPAWEGASVKGVDAVG